MQHFKVRLTGATPLLVHSDHLANPLAKATQEHKALTAKRKKTDEDHWAIAFSEFKSSLYMDKDGGGPYIPSINVEASLIAGAKLSKLGTTIKRAVNVPMAKCHLEYDGPRDVVGLWGDGDSPFVDARSVVVGQKRIIRYRPIFTKWALECDVLFDECAIDQREILKCFKSAGDYCGLGDFRPKFGKYTVKEVK